MAKTKKKLAKQEPVQIRTEDKGKFDSLLDAMIKHKPLPKTDVRIRRSPKTKKILA